MLWSLFLDIRRRKYDLQCSDTNSRKWTWWWPHWTETYCSSERTVNWVCEKWQTRKTINWQVRFYILMNFQVSFGFLKYWCSKYQICVCSSFFISPSAVEKQLCYVMILVIGERSMESTEKITGIVAFFTHGQKVKHFMSMCPFVCDQKWVAITVN